MTWCWRYQTRRCWVIRCGPRSVTATETSWAAAVPELGPSLATMDSRHSYAVLTGLTSSTGGMVAAATMSLPERSKAGRNYDYRYVWIRDRCCAGQAVAADGPHRLLDDAVSFIAQRILADGPDLKPAYTVARGAVPGEESLAHLSGYPGGADKIGNWSTASSSWTRWARRSSSSRPRPATITWTAGTGRPLSSR